MAQSTRKRVTRLPAVFTENLGLKIFSLASSVLLFSIVHSDVDAQRSLFVDVVALLPPPDSDHMLVSEIPDRVRVTLRGSRSRISELSRDDLPPLQIDLTDSTRGLYYFDPSAMELGGNVQVVEVVPSTLTLQWARTVEKEVKLVPRLVGEPPSGYSVREPVKVNPETVTLRGPEHTLDGINSVQTDIIALDRLPTGEQKLDVLLQPLPEHVSVLESVSPQVDVVIERVITERKLRRLDVAIVGAEDATMRPRRVSITVRGPVDVVAELEPEQLVPYVEVTADPTQVGMRPVDVKVRGVPEGVEVTEVAPSTVLVLAR
jgi:YbbR domain-containing protein